MTRKHTSGGGAWFNAGNMTMLLLLALMGSIGFLYFYIFSRQYGKNEGLGTVVTKDPFNDPYAPPLNNGGMYYPNRGQPPPQQAIPINIPTQSLGYDTQYSQIGILTRADNSTHHDSNNLILPLFGKRVTNNKYAYYSISNSGLHMKLPISVNGKKCTGDRGCDLISNGDTVYVEGYSDIFRATVYDTENLAYIPVL